MPRASAGRDAEDASAGRVAGCSCDGDRAVRDPAARGARRLSFAHRAECVSGGRAAGRLSGGGGCGWSSAACGQGDASAGRGFDCASRARAVSRFCAGPAVERGLVGFSVVRAALDGRGGRGSVQPSLAGRQVGASGAGGLCVGSASAGRGFVHACFELRRPCLGRARRSMLLFHLRRQARFRWAGRQLLVPWTRLWLVFCRPRRGGLFRWPPLPRRLTEARRLRRLRRTRPPRALREMPFRLTGLGRSPLRTLLGR
jgi:hypothetical protein